MLSYTYLTHQKYTNPYLYVILGALVGGSAGIFVKSLQMPVTSIAFFRFIVPTVIFGIFF